MFILRRNSLGLLLSGPAGGLGFRLMEGSIVLLADLFYEMCASMERGYKNVSAESLGSARMPTMYVFGPRSTSSLAGNAHK
jgi:hypothetical protein